MISSKDYLHIICKCAQISIFTFCIYKYMYFQKKEIIVISIIVNRKFIKLQTIIIVIFLSLLMMCGTLKMQSLCEGILKLQNNHHYHDE